ncbi:hypothetical protein L596_021480 [Steinernema carpocapsae]|uniref:Uncharacterized protein n=1 Tax=Steinernema carpocapsae TaxID=34508 RepID=A0A4U5MIW7_STECR|nr:hypothetical protein L596_021480 [Steinernema carpocapsae]
MMRRHHAALSVFLLSLATMALATKNDLSASAPAGSNHPQPEPTASFSIPTTSTTIFPTAPEQTLSVIILVNGAEIVGPIDFQSLKRTTSELLRLTMPEETHISFINSGPSQWTTLREFSSEKYMASLQRTSSERIMRYETHCCHSFYNHSVHFMK